MQLNELIEEFLMELEIRNCSKETIRSYKNSLKIFNEYLGDVEIEEVKSIDVKAFTIFNKERGLKQKSQNIYVSSIRALYSYLIEEEIVMKNLGYSVKLLNAKDKKDIEIFTNDEIKKLISYKRPSTQKENKYLAIRDNSIINFLLETGCRNHELTNLRQIIKLLGHCNVSITEEYLRGLTKLDILEMSKGCSILENI